MTRRKFVLIAIILLAIAGSYLGKKLYRQETSATGALTFSDPKEKDQAAFRKIVSLAPSITETLFLLGVGERVVGVTRYCTFPPDALSKTKIGGYYDPNYEAIVALGPDLIIMLTEHEEEEKHLTELGFATLAVDHKTISGILSSIEAIGKACGVEKRAACVMSDILQRMEHIRLKTEGSPHPKVMVSVGRNMGSGSLKDVYISGRSDFYDEMIRHAGGVNAYDGNVTFPAVSEEGIIRMSPDVIIDMIPDLAKKGWDKAMILKEWETVSLVEAVKKGRVYVFGEDYVVVPGPRFILILEKMARAIHPGLDW